VQGLLGVNEMSELQEIKKRKEEIKKMNLNLDPDRIKEWVELCSREREIENDLEYVNECFKKVGLG